MANKKIHHGRTMSRDALAINIVGYLLIGIFGLLCVIPFYLIIVASFTSEASLIRNGYPLIPTDFSIQSYLLCLKNPLSILKAYGTTIGVTMAGTLISVFIATMTGYVLSRKDFPWRNQLSFFFFFTTLWNMIIAKSFMAGIPSAISESAKMDGANDLVIFIRLILPLSKPLLATLSLFSALAYWNDWYNCMLYITNENMFTLQYYLQRMLGSAEAMRIVAEKSGMALPSVPLESMKMAMTVIATGPIVLLYPFVQRYFVKGLTIGAVKG